VKIFFYEHALQGRIPQQQHQLIFIKVGHLIKKLVCKSEVIWRGITMWTNFYLPRGSLVNIYAFFLKGITFTFEVRFQGHFF
jgi:hypothetical protein